MTPIVDVQELSIVILEFALRLSAHTSNNWEAIGDEFLIEYDNQSMVLSFTVEGISIVDVGARVKDDHIKVWVIEDHIRMGNLEFPTTYFDSLFTAFNLCGVQQGSLDIKIRRHSAHRGAMECRFEKFGSVYIEYTIDPANNISVVRSGAVENPLIRLRSIL